MAAKKSALLTKSPADIAKALPSLQRDELIALLAHEEAGDNRDTVLEIIGAEINKRDELDREETARQALAKASQPPNFLDRDYTGPLTGEQALARNEHLGANGWRHPISKSAKGEA